MSGRKSRQKPFSERQPISRSLLIRPLDGCRPRDRSHARRTTSRRSVLPSKTGTQGWYPEPFIARTGEELAQAQGSTYALVPHLKAFKEIGRIDGKYAVVGLPCHMHALRRYQKFSKKLAQRIKLTIGLYCNLAFEPYVVDDLCELAGISRCDVSKFSFQYGRWPGGLAAQCRDATIR